MKSVMNTDISEPKDSAKLGSIKALLGIAKSMEMEDAKNFKKKKKGAACEVEMEPAEGAE